MTPFDIILHFLLELTAVRRVPNLKFLALTVREILGGPRITKVDHLTTT